MLDQKWLGTDLDRREMRTLKLEQVVRRNFGYVTMFAFSSTLLCTWEVLAISLGVVLPNGGTAGIFWNYIITAIGLAFVYASLAELASMMPTSGGQYYWIAVLAPRRYRRYLSYIAGWLCAITWQTGVAGGAYIGGTLIQGLFVLNIETYNYQRWHGTLLTLAFILIAVFFNTILARKLPLVEGIFIFGHILGVAIFIPLWVLAPKREGGSPLTEFYNGGGWSSNGLATMVGTIGPATALIGFDCAIHMAEETKDSSRAVPITLLVGYTSNVILGFFVIMTCIYTLGPLDQSLNATTGYPILNLFFDTTKSLAATNVMTAVILVNETVGTIASLAAASRQLWAFARNNGLPFSNFFAPHHLAHDIPLNSVLFSLIIPIIVALINIGSASALGIILSVYNSALLASYAITITCVLLHRLQGRKLPQSRYSLGKWGILVNVLALIYITPIFVFSFFPSAPNPTLINMNWALAMVGGISLLATIYYIIWGRNIYTPPDETIEDYMERYGTASEQDVSGTVAEVNVETEKRD